MEEHEKKEEKETKKEEIKKLSEKEILDIIKHAAEKGMTSEKIGLELKKHHANIKDIKSKIGKILKEKFTSPDIKNLKEKIEQLKKHISIHKHDFKTKRTLLIKQGKLKKLSSLN